MRPFIGSSLKNMHGMKASSPMARLAVSVCLELAERLLATFAHNSFRYFSASLLQNFSTKSFEHGDAQERR